MSSPLSLRIDCGFPYAATGRHSHRGPVAEGGGGEGLSHADNGAGAQGEVVSDEHFAVDGIIYNRRQVPPIGTAKRTIGAENEIFQQPA
jgi:hypothetical protein